MLCLSTNNLLLLLLGLESYSIGVVFLISMSNCGDKYTVSMRYLITSAVFSSIFFYGLSLYYACFGTVSIFGIDCEKENAVSNFGLLLMLCSIFFKMSLAPFHLWAPSIYKNASNLVVCFLELVPKISFVLILVYLISIWAAQEILIYKPILFATSGVSMLVGAIGAVKEDNIKRFIAYSTTGHLGFALTPLAVFEKPAELSFVMDYIVIHLFSSLLLFLIIFLLESAKKETSTFSDIRGLIKVLPYSAYLFLIYLLSTFGAPPFMNFFAKINIFYFLIQNKSYILLSLAILYSILLIIYTIRIIKVIFIDRDLTQERVIAPYRNSKYVLVSSFLVAGALTIGGFFIDPVNVFTKKIATKI
jgi:NADH-quinone oxidoreductase subunit N